MDKKGIAVWLPIRKENFLVSKSPDHLWGLTPSFSMCTGVLSWEENGQSVTLTTHLLLVEKV